MALTRVLEYWKLYTTLLTPILLSFIFLESTGKAALCGYTIILMAIYWMTEALPLAVTALIPVFMFPLMGILASSDVSMLYMKETNMMFLGGLMVALSIENSNLHKRIALFVVLHVGFSPPRLMAGFMLTTMFLSMWISNTASTAMMIPIVDAVLQELYKATIVEKEFSKETNGRSKQDTDNMNPDAFHSQIELVETPNNSQFQETRNEFKDLNVEKGTKGGPAPDGSKSLTAIPPNKECQAMKDMYFLATAYAANIGGTGSLTGTGPNLVVKETLQSSFPEQNDLNFATWMIFNVPGMLLCTILGWLWLQLLFIGIGSRSKLPKSTPEVRAKISNVIRGKYEKLGTMTFQELAVLIVFIFLVLCWFFREPGFLPGWEKRLKDIYGESFKVGDAVPAILSAAILFVIPIYPNFWPNQRFKNGPSKSCLEWNIIHDKLPWGIILLLGGGFAMAEASKVSGLSTFLGEKLRALDALPISLNVFIVSILAAMVTEVSSNTATASIIMPILEEVALGICVNPLYLMLPAAVSCSYAFMLPVATPPNAIVFGAAGMSTTVMMKAGIVMNILCVLVINVMINLLGVNMFDLTHIPPWVNSSYFPTTCLENGTIT